MSEKIERTIEETGLPSAEVIAETEYDLVESLLEAASYKTDEKLQKKVRIERDGKFLFSFTVAPLSEDDMRIARKQSAVMMKNPAGKHLPAVEKEVNYFKFKSLKIYYATIPEDRAKIWDNKVVKEKFGLVEGWETVDKLLTAGYKSAVNDLIDEISGYDVDLTEYAKN